MTKYVISASSKPKQGNLKTLTLLPNSACTKKQQKQTKNNHHQQKKLGLHEQTPKLEEEELGREGRMPGSEDWYP